MIARFQCREPHQANRPFGTRSRSRLVEGFLQPSPNRIETSLFQIDFEGLDEKKERQYGARLLKHLNELKRIMYKFDPKRAYWRGLAGPYFISKNDKNLKKSGAIFIRKWGGLYKHLAGAIVIPPKSFSKEYKLRLIIVHEALHRYWAYHATPGFKKSVYETWRQWLEDFERDTAKVDAKKLVDLYDQSDRGLYGMAYLSQKLGMNQRFVTKEQYDSLISLMWNAQALSSAEEFFTIAISNLIVNPPKNFVEVTNSFAAQPQMRLQGRQIQRQVPVERPQRDWRQQWRSVIHGSS